MINLTCSVSWEQSPEMTELLIPSPRPSLLPCLSFRSLSAGTFVGPEMVPACRGAVASDGRGKKAASQ